MPIGVYRKPSVSPSWEKQQQQQQTHKDTLFPHSSSAGRHWWGSRREIFEISKLWGLCLGSIHGHPATIIFNLIISLYNICLSHLHSYTSSYHYPIWIANYIKLSDVTVVTSLSFLQGLCWLRSTSDQWSPASDKSDISQSLLQLSGLKSWVPKRTEGTGNNKWLHW